MIYELLEKIPKSVIKLKLQTIEGNQHYNYFRSIEHKIPDHIETLIIGNNLKIGIPPIRLPKNLKKLIIFDKYKRLFSNIPETINLICYK